MSLLDWDKNVDPHYRKNNFRPPLTVAETEDYTEKWIAYGNPYIAAKELTVQPGKSVTITDATAYGCILVQGYGKLGSFDCATATMLRFGGKSQDPPLPPPRVSPSRTTAPASHWLCSSISLSMMACLSKRESNVRRKYHVPSIQASRDQ